MAAQTASPEEAAVARDLLARMPAPRTLSRADILAMPDLRAHVASRRIYDPSLRVVVVMDEDDPAFAAWSSPHDWDGVE